MTCNHAEEISALRALATELMEHLTRIRADAVAFTLPNTDGVHFERWQRQYLSILYRRIGHPVPHDTALDALYSLECGRDVPSIRTIHVEVCRIRKKLKGTPYRIDNYHGVGYALVQRAQVAA